MLTKYISNRKIQKAIYQQASLINSVYTDFNGKSVLVMPILDGALIYAADLIRHFTFPIELHPLRVKSYRGTESSGEFTPCSTWPSNKDLLARRVLILDDVLDTGKTAYYVTKNLYTTSNPLSIQVAVAFDKMLGPIRPNFRALEIENKFVVGYGLDLDGAYRNLPDLRIYTPDERV